MWRAFFECVQAPLNSKKAMQLCCTAFLIFLHAVAAKRSDFSGFHGSYPLPFPPS